MKKLILPILILCMILTGCTAPSLPLKDEETTAEETTIRYILNEDSVHNAFRKALEVYGWFDLCSMEMDYSKTAQINGQTYYKVISSEVVSYSELRTLVYSLFSVETGDRLLDENSETPKYIDYNGELYGIDAARGADTGKGEYTAEVEYVSNTSILYKVRVELIDFDENAGIDNYRKVVGYEDYTYNYEYINNKWVFTNFSLYY